MIKITLNKTSVIPSIPLSFRRIENSAWERNHPHRAAKLQKRIESVEPFKLGEKENQLTHKIMIFIS